MYRYQIWMQHKWHEKNSSPEEIVYSLDKAILRAKEISKNTITWVSVPDNPFAGPSFEQKNPVLFVMDCCQTPSRLRGFAHKGKWRDALDTCKSCHNMSSDSDDCHACGGATWKPY